MISPASYEIERMANGHFDAPLPNSADDYGWRGDADVTRPTPPIPPLEVICAASLAGKDVPERPWVVRDMVPDRTVTVLSGDGGVGKSKIAMQLGVAVATGKDWIGTMPEFGPVLYASAEDDIDEIHRRLAEIVRSKDISLADLKDFHIVALAGKDAILGSPDRSGTIAATPLWNAVAALTGRLKPKLVILDNLADVFAGNENSRPEARQFIGLLRGLAIEHTLAVLLIAHPSLSGLASGSGTSGSTAWSNSVRSRLYLDRAKSEDGTEADQDVRILRTMKANYAPLGGEIRLRWDAGSFRLDGSASGFDRLAAEANADTVFLDLVAKFQTEGRDVSASPSPNFAPVIFSKHPSCKGLSAKILRSAMDRMFAAGKIKIDTFGPPSRQRTRLILATEKGEQ